MQHGIAAHTPSMGNSPFPGSVLPPLCSSVFSCYLCFPQTLALSRLADETSPSYLPCTQTLVLEGPLLAKPGLRQTLLTSPKASVFSEAIFMTTYKLDTDCLICIGARHRDAQHLAGMPRREGGWVLQEGWRQGPCLCSCGDCCWQGKRGLLEPKKFQIKAVKGFLNLFSLPALHQHSLMLCFKQKLAVVKLLCV